MLRLGQKLVNNIPTKLSSQCKLTNGSFLESNWSQFRPKHRSFSSTAEPPKSNITPEEALKREAIAKKEAEEALKREAEAKKASEETLKREAAAKKEKEEALKREAAAKKESEEALKREAAAKKEAEEALKKAEAAKKEKEDFIQRQAKKAEESKSPTYKQLKHQLRTDPPRFMSLWYLAGATGFTAAVVYYVNDSDHYDRKVERAVKMVNSPDLDTRRKGLEDLDSCLYYEKRLITTSTPVVIDVLIVEIPKPKSGLVDKGAVEALYEAIKSEDDGIREKALVWLIRLCEVPEGRKRVLSEGLDPIIEIIQQQTSGSTLWLQGSALLYTLSQYKDSKSSLVNSSIVNTINNMYDSGHPLAALMAAKLVTSIFENEQGMKLLPQLTVPLDKVGPLTSPQSTSALVAAMGSVIPKEPKLKNPALGSNTMSNAQWAVFFGVLGGVWGRFRWIFRALRSGLPVTSVWKFAKKHSKTGRYTFFLLMLDIFAEGLMVWPQQGLNIPLLNKPLQLPDKVLGVNMDTAIPIGEAGLFTAMSLLVLRQQRYIVLPIFLASVRAYWDHIGQYAAPYLEVIGMSASKQIGEIKLPQIPSPWSEGDKEKDDKK